MRIVIAGTAAGVSGQAGASWAMLQYVIGLRDLGHDVWLIEPVERVDRTTRRSYERLVAEFELGDRAALLIGDRRMTLGVAYQSLRAACCSADLLLNVSGLLTDPDLLEGPSVRAYLDLDPAFNQLWHSSGIDRGFAGHERHFTVGGAIGLDGCPVPTCGIDWIPTLPPVVLRHWPAAPAAVCGPLTTVANWRSYGSIDWEGTFYGQKAHSLRPLSELPRHAGERFVLALAIHPDETHDLRMLADGGWRLEDPRRVAGTTRAYRDFIAGSKAELGIAKAGYATARCGWFSDRSACYLASGKPVLAQDTGLSGLLPTGEGLLTFATVEQAVGAIGELARDYARHSRAARELAESHLDSRRVLIRLLERVGW
jgi:hypothetical protein